jgi:SulP family sulfate permease
MERLRPHSPAPLVIVAGAIAVSWLLGLAQLGVSTVGHIPQGLPSITLPDPTLVQSLLPATLSLALMSFTETIAAGRAFLSPWDPPVDAGRELVATGAANLAGGLLGAMPAGGGTSQTGVVRSAGGRSQKVSLVTAAAALATMLVLAPILGFLPNAVLAAIVIVYSIVLIKPAEFLQIERVRRMEFWWALVAAIGVLTFGTLQGIVIAIVLSLVTLAHQAAHPHVFVIGRKRGADVLRPLSPEHPDDETFEGLLIVRPEGRLFFVNAQNVADQIGALVAQHKPRVLALDLSRSSRPIRQSSGQPSRTRSGHGGRDATSDCKPWLRRHPRRWIRSSSCAPEPNPWRSVLPSLRSSPTRGSPSTRRSTPRRNCVFASWPSTRCER